MTRSRTSSTAPANEIVNQCNGLLKYNVKTISHGVIVINAAVYGFRAMYKPFHSPE
jgi:hypothetical protein